MSLKNIISAYPGLLKLELVAPENHETLNILLQIWNFAWGHPQILELKAIETEQRAGLKFCLMFVLIILCLLLVSESTWKHFQEFFLCNFVGFIYMYHL